MKVAALDLGSNSFLCLIVEGTATGISKVIQDESRIVKLAQGLLHSGKLHHDAIARAEETLKEFRKFLDKENPDQVKAVATAAVREASNKDIFFDLLKKYSIPLQILSGDEEAEMTFRGACGSGSNSGEQILIDIGGGSTEIIWGIDGNIKWAHSFPIGVVKLTERFIHNQPFDLNGASDIINDLNNIFAGKLCGLGLQVSNPRLKAVAGTPTTLAGVIIGGYDPKKVDGFQLSKEDLQNWTKTFASMSISEKELKFKIGGRAEVILAGCILLEYLRNYFKQETIEVSIRGVRYGLAEKLLRI